ncbi:hypothetical protein GCM10011583_09610 [Streptomyces camponoticapitis]|uniref:YdhG-like domain-containing protein n=1 Tax=Streptomyces camponoticapitis TaxID=1616125 RepID=A0ABQ2DZ72_9ACTN|nr:DUF1801 domain-containing protein [Streptomyces camponoticapitis]GGJ80135.1 hypothetical protein GCM10011583_09610 [Streptomyces camponoticapitis]
MNDDITNYIEKTQHWQAQVCTKLREVVHSTIPGAEEAFQYGKPHFLRDGRHAAVIHVARDKVTFMVFDAESIEAVPKLLRPLGKGERKAVDIREGDSVDYDFVADVLRRTSGAR